MRPWFLKNLVLALIVIATVPSLALSASQEETPIPRGIYLAYGRALNERLLQVPYLTGVLVRVHWREIEPTEAHYDWSYPRREIDLAKRYGKKITLAIVAGPATPDWVYAAGATSFQFTFRNPHSPRGGRPERIPLPWDPVFLDKWTQTITALGREFGNDPAIALVHITGSSKNGFELQLPEDPPRPRLGPPSGPWVGRGYTREGFVNAWKRVIDAFARAFPRQALDLEMHPILGDSAIPAQLAGYGYQRLGKRFGTFGAWLSGRQLAWDAEIRQIMARQCRLSFCNYQLIANETRQAQRLGPGGLLGAIQSGFDHGARYFEVWEADIRNSRFDDDLLRISRQIAVH